MEILYALERIYLKKLAQTPSDAELNANIGAIKQAQGDLETALSYYGKAEQLNPSNITTRLNVGTLFQQRKEYAKAIKSYDSILSLYPNNTQALLYKAQVYSEMGDKKEALNYYKKVLSIDPANSVAKAEVNEVMKATLSPTELIDYLAKNGRESELYDYAYQLHKENKLSEAITAYKTLIAKYQTNSDAYVNLAVCYAALNDYPNSIKVLNEAKTKFPNNSLIVKTPTGIASIPKSSICDVVEEEE
jgi:tetratricopeptide (TPR) repeat protein